MKRKILVTGALGQIGSDLVTALTERYGADLVISSDIKEKPSNYQGNYYQIDVLDFEKVQSLIEENNVRVVYHLVSLLSATAEQKPLIAWRLNTSSLVFMLELAKKGIIEQIFWPSSIAVFGPNAPKDNTPQDAPLDPTTIYGVSKVAGEKLCEYYHNTYGVDVRSLRYPGLISWKTKAGGGTTDYAVDIFHHALEQGKYTCFLKEDTKLPMMYMDDAIRGTLELMEAPSEKITIRTSYNFSAMSFTPAELAKEIQKIIPRFTIEYAPDFRQAIADSWPHSIDFSHASKDWDWKPFFDLSSMVREMISKLSKTESTVSVE